MMRARILERIYGETKEETEESGGEYRMNDNTVKKKKKDEGIICKVRNQTTSKPQTSHKEGQAKTKKWPGWWKSSWSFFGTRSITQSLCMSLNVASLNVIVS